MSVLQTTNEEYVYFNYKFSEIRCYKENLRKRNKKIMALCDIEKLSDLLKIDPQKQIVKYLISEREKGLSFNSINLIFMQFTILRNQCEDIWLCMNHLKKSKINRWIKYD